LFVKTTGVDGGGVDLPTRRVKMEVWSDEGAGDSFDLRVVEIRADKHSGRRVSLWVRVGRVFLS
jgi:hypothetical protein